MNCLQDVVAEALSPPSTKGKDHRARGGAQPKPDSPARPSRASWNKILAVELDRKATADKDNGECAFRKKINHGIGMVRVKEPIR